MATQHKTLYASNNICMQSLPNNFNLAKDCQWCSVMLCNVPLGVLLSKHVNQGHKNATGSILQKEIAKNRHVEKLSFRGSALKYTCPVFLII